MAEPSPLSDPWYPEAGDYYVPAAEAGSYPLRQGDVLGPIEVGGEEWTGVQLIHPSCEIPKASSKDLLVARVRPLSAIADPKQQARVTTGWEERDGAFRIAFAHTFFLAPPPGAVGSTEPLFSSLRDVARVDREMVGLGSRVAALTHDARVAFIRRSLYFWFRYLFSTTQVRAWEAARIGTDKAFAGPRPDWA